MISFLLLWSSFPLSLKETVSSFNPSVILKRLKFLFIYEPTMLHSLFLFQGHSWTTIPHSYCNINWGADWKRKMIKTVDDCKASCENTADCTTIVHGTYGGISNNCALCTDNNLRSINGLWSTTYVWTGTNPLLFIFLFIYI